MIFRKFQIQLIYENPQRIYYRPKLITKKLPKERHFYEWRNWHAKTLTRRTQWSKPYQLITGKNLVCENTVPILFAILFAILHGIIAIFWFIKCPRSLNNLSSVFVKAELITGAITPRAEFKLPKCREERMGNISAIIGRGSGRLTHLNERWIIECVCSGMPHVGLSRKKLIDPLSFTHSPESRPGKINRETKCFKLRVHKNEWSMVIVFFPFKLF